MSDEKPVPQLRLRPRKRDDDSAPVETALSRPHVPSPDFPVTPPLPPPHPVAEPVPEVLTAAEFAPLRFRLKPKLSSETEVGADVVSPELMPTISPILISAEGPASTPDLQTPSAIEITRLKLKHIAAEEGSAVSPIPASHQLTPPLTDTEPFIPEELIVGLPSVVVEAGRLSVPPVAVPLPYNAKSNRKRRDATIVLVAIVVVILLIGAGVYFIYLKGDSGAAASSPVIAKQVVPVVETPTPTTAPIAPLPPPPAMLQAVFNTPNSKATAILPVATEAFRSWVSSVRISGVRAGELPMAIVNGRLARPGDVVDAAEDIVFEGVDGEQKLLSFCGHNGAVLTKPY